MHVWNNLSLGKIYLVSFVFKWQKSLLFNLTIEQMDLMWKKRSKVHQINEDDNTKCSKGIYCMPHPPPPSHPVEKHFLRTPSVSITPVTLKRKFCTNTAKKEGMFKKERHLFLATLVR
jgi:hypothetical protein